MVDLKKSLLHIIEEVYNKKFIGKLSIKKLEPKGTSAILHLNDEYGKLSISADLEGEEFLKYFKSEIRNRRLNASAWFVIKQNIPYNPRCNDK